MADDDGDWVACPACGKLYHPNASSPAVAAHIRKHIAGGVAESVFHVCNRGGCRCMFLTRARLEQHIDQHFRKHDKPPLHPEAVTARTKQAKYVASIAGLPYPEFLTKLLNGA